MSVLSNEVIHGNVAFSDRVFRNSPVLPTDVIVQINLKVTNASGAGGVVLRANSPAGGSLGYALVWNEGSNQWQIWDEQPSVLVASVGDADRFNNWNIVRAVTEVSGPNLILKLYGVNAASGTDLTPQPVLKTSWTDTTPLPLGYWGIVMGWWSGAADTIRAFGRVITLTGLPTGWKVQIDSETPVVESGGSVSISAEGLVMPATTIKVLDGSDVEQANLSPVGGFWGGATFSYAPTGTPIGEIAWESLTGLEPDFTTPIEILASAVQSEWTPMAWEGRLTKPVSPFWEAAGPVTPSLSVVPWESLLSIAQQDTVDWASIGSVRNDEAIWWEARGEIQSPRSTAWESGQILHPVTQTPWESLFGASSSVNCPWESNRTLRRASSPLYERLQGISRSRTAPWASEGRIVASEAIFMELLLGLQTEILVPWEAEGRLAVLVSPFWESRGDVFESVETLYEILQGGSGQTVSVETLYEVLLGVRNAEAIPYEVIPGLGTILGPTVTIQRRRVLRPTRAALPFPEPALYDPVTGELHDPERAIIGPPQPVFALITIPWESTE